MNLWNTIKEKFHLAPEYDEYHDEYDDDFYDDEPDQYGEPSDAQQQVGGARDSRRGDRADRGRQATGGFSGNGLLGNTPRPEADSVSVYTRSGRPLGGNGGGLAQTTYPEDEPEMPRRFGSSFGSTAGRTTGLGTVASATSAVASVAADIDESADDATSVNTAATAPAAGNHAASAGSSQPTRSMAIPRASRSGHEGRGVSQLPAYVLMPQSYEDCQTVVRRVKTNQPVVLLFRNTNLDSAKRIFDFCAGLACGVNGQIQELGAQCFVVLPEGKELSAQEIAKLTADGTIVRD